MWRAHGKAFEYLGCYLDERQQFSARLVWIELNMMVSLAWMLRGDVREPCWIRPGVRSPSGFDARHLALAPLTLATRVLQELQLHALKNNTARLQSTLVKTYCRPI